MDLAAEFNDLMLGLPTMTQLLFVSTLLIVCDNLEELQG